MDFRFKAGSAPMLLSMPHVGTDIPDEVAAHMTPCALARADTDWHLAELYGFAERMGVSTLAARWSRYVIDLNRPPEDTNLYPGMDTTGLCPVDTFGRESLYQEGRAPDQAEVRGASSVTGGPTITSCVPNWRACWRCTAAWCCGTPIPSPRPCRAFSRAACRT
jgi:N-formylglutamate amidohydrolase